MLQTLPQPKLTAFLILTCATIAMAQDHLVAQQDSDLSNARNCANWLDSVSVIESGQRYWPTVPGESKKTSNNLYSGNPGVILFYLELHLATGEQAYLQSAIEGGDWLREHALDFTTNPDTAFFTGTSGVGFVVDQLFHASKLPRFQTAGQRCYDYLVNSCKESGYEGRKMVHWNDVTDVIGGTAGIGFYLLESRQYDNRSQALKMAIMAGDNLLAQAEPVESSEGRTGFKWMMSPTFPREMPNYSHGTAGICDFLLSLDQACRADEKSAEQYDGRFLKGALKGAEYLEKLASQSVKSGLIPHNFPDGEQLFYLGWCHGPAGTVRFLDRLEKQSLDNRWGKVSQEITRSLYRQGIPKNRPEGFWNNAGLCCGNAGVASFLLDRVEVNRDQQALELADALTSDILQRAARERLSNGETGFYWTHAEHRVRPDFLQAQTGLMQGAAGIGMYFIRRHQMANNKRLASNLPMMPY